MRATDPASLSGGYQHLPEHSGLKEFLSQDMPHCRGAGDRFAVALATAGWLLSWIAVAALIFVPHEKHRLVETALLGGLMFANLCLLLVIRHIEIRNLRGYQAEQARLGSALRHVATTDPLTGLYNRQELKRRLDGLVASRELRHPTALVVLDIDNFKEVNDAHGHEAGDKVLTAIASAIASLAPDGAFRLGDDEFGLLISPDEIVPIIRELRRRLRRPGIRWNGNRIFLSFSVGLTQSNGVFYKTADELLAEAYRDLHQVKAAHREGAWA